ncbi:alpha/beta hydrolase family protein [Yoonia sp. BS5-3]|uniref:Alpha/beta hydrolase family protein n=1 Tax=Yoonia phaeophyticola TaxID=3137369 RepID=A0ABZ2V3Z6_9RHOB
MTFFAVTAAVVLSACGAVSQIAKRPQDPVDRPYKVETVRFPGGSGVTLAGELTMPLAGDAFKAVVLVSGSGPQDRDEALAGHRPFLVLSDHLTRAGFAVLRYDDRGFGQSTGAFDTADLHDFAADAAGAFRFLAARPDVDASSVGFIGQSEGGVIAPLAADQVDPAFMVFLAAPARQLFPDVLATQLADIARVEGASEAEIAASDTIVRDGSAILGRNAPLSQIRADLDAYLKSQGLGRTERRTYLDQFATRWGISHARHDPAAALRRLRMPVLALFGEKDLQVSATYEAPAMRAALRHPRSKVQVIGGANHLFQPAGSGHPSEYEKIDITLSTSVLNLISDWMGAR